MTTQLLTYCSLTPIILDSTNILLSLKSANHLIMPRYMSKLASVKKTLISSKQASNLTVRKRRIICLLLLDNFHLWSLIILYIMTKFNMLSTLLALLFEKLGTTLPLSNASLNTLSYGGMRNVPVYFRHIGIVVS